jgi:hypothetical protein
VVALLTRAVVDQSARMPGGLLARSLPAPTGWETGGLSVPFYGCGEPVLRDKCVEGTDVPHRLGSVGDFYAVPIEQGVTCSTTNDQNLDAQARDRFLSSADWALGRQLQTDAIDSGAPKLEDATSLGVVADANFVGAVGCLEQAAADNGFGSKFMLHAPVRAAAYLAANGLLDVNGLSPTGAQWVISAGYLADPEDTGTSIRLYATGQVWASVDTPTVSGERIDYRQNDADAWAVGTGVVAFDPCVLVAIDVTVGACP